jgi:hypothetical protein
MVAVLLFAPSHAVTFDPFNFQNFTLYNLRPNPVPNNDGPDPTCGAIGQPPCRPCGKDGELPCGYAPVRVGTIKDGDYQTNPYKMFWKKHTPAQLAVCQFAAPGVTPLTWKSPSTPNGKEYMLVNGDINVHVDNFKRNWWDAQAYCVSQSATLVNIKSQAENDFVWCLQPMLENRWLGQRLLWAQSPNFDIQMQLAIDSYTGPAGRPICFNFNGQRICDLPPLNYLNGKLRSAEKRKSRRTMNTLLFAGNYSDGTQFLPDFRTRNPGAQTFYSATGVFGNPEVRRPYIVSGGYKTIAPWHENEPNNRRGMEQCVEMGKAWARHAPLGEWNDFYCGAEKAFVCERPQV